MNDEQYAYTQQQLLAFSAVVAEMDLTGFLERISAAETLGLMLEPMLYMQAAGNLNRIKRLARSLRSFQATVLEVRQEATGQPEKGGG